MKNLAFILLLLLPFVSSAKKRADYERAMGRFMKFYNQGQADSIANLFSDEWGVHKKDLFTKTEIDRLKMRYGNMKSFTYLGVESYDTVILFRTVFTKNIQASGLTLDKKNKLLMFRFNTSSKYINELLKKYRK